jgi:hypothetical protein
VRARGSQQLLDEGASGFSNLEELKKLLGIRDGLSGLV